MPVLLETLDQKIATTLSDWNLYTTLIAVSIVAFLAYPIVYPSEPDTHPLLLARQASAAPVRNKNESAVYRSPEIPHGYPLKSGLNVKQPDEPRWKSGKDGDLRDIWREVLRGGRVGTDGKEVPQGSIMSVFGKEKVEEHDLAQLSKQINVLGKFWKESSQGKVAIYLPNNIEYLVTIFGECPAARILRYFSNTTQPALSTALHQCYSLTTCLLRRSTSFSTWSTPTPWSVKLALSLSMA